MIQIEDSRFNLTLTNDVVNECFGKDLSKMDEEQSKLLILSHKFEITYKSVQAEVVKLVKITEKFNR